ncbi:MAG: DNA mismatch repair protein MutS [Deltaproteobacteria bacterium]|nr:DNA mismatch repair protein MutS [Deltaproteobacteria bacterium]MBW2665334.1 DNA mismatch repair protein MutS [Deltaproteobacteria bacterium]
MSATNGCGAEPADEYTRRLASRRNAADACHRRSAVVSNVRLAVFAAGVAVAAAVFGPKVLSEAWLLPPLVVFIGLVVVHDRLIRRGDRAERAVAFYEAGVARLEGRWMGRSESSGEAFREAAHPYSEDLDLFGQGSLFELLSLARTRAGECTLAAWLLSPATAEEVIARQPAVAELAPKLDLREDLWLIGAPVAAGMHPEELRRWGDAEPSASGKGLRLVAPVLASLTIAALVAWWTLGIGSVPFQVMLVIQSGFALSLRGRVRQTILAVDAPCRDLALFSALLERLESEDFDAPRLRSLLEALDSGEHLASERIARLRRYVDLLDARRNQLFVPIGALLLWSTQLALAIEDWRIAWGPKLGEWLEAVGEIEALASLAGFHFENPTSVFPEILAEGTRFEAMALAHPLLPSERRIVNDVALGEELQLLVVSGSNMSGKSTLLRTVGTNAVLALAGGAVVAEHLRVSRLAIGASIRIQDSLLEGSSHFYAEIQRLRQIMELADGETPLLFLVDEILHGTNSHDRGVGAEAVVRGFVERGALGLVTTHDLALARVADALAPRAANVHFEDHLEAGVIAFDYRLRPGVVEKSNALELMRAVGLAV